MSTFNYFKGKDKYDTNIEKNANIIELNRSKEFINESINELKTLNECINNGQINTSFS